MIISADIHVKQYSSHATLDKLGRNSRMMDCINVLRKLCQLAKEDDKRLVIAGDMFDERDYISTESYTLVYDCLKEAKEAGVETAVVLGNHEVLDKKSNVSALYPLESVARVVAVPEVVYFGEQQNVAFCFLPWLSDWTMLPDYVKDMVVSTKDAAYRLLIGHVPVIGAALGASNYRLREGCVRVEDLSPKDFQQVILGHYHKAQSLQENVHYVGSPLQLNFGESQDSKRVFKFDLQNGILTSIPVEGIPKFYEAAYEAGQVHVVTEEERAYGFLKVYCRAEDNLRDVQLAIDEVRQVHDFRSVQLERIQSRKEHEVRLDVTAETKDVDVLSGYVDYVTTSLDKQLLLSLGERLMHGKSAKDIVSEIVL